MKAPLFSLLPFLFLLSGLHLLLPFVIEIQSVLSHFFFNRPFFPPLTLTTVCHVRRRNRNTVSKLFLTFHHRRTTDQHRGRCNNTETTIERPPPIFELTSCACVSHRGAAAAVPFITRGANERPVLRGDRTELKKKKKRGKGFFFSLSSSLSFWRRWYTTRYTLGSRALRLSAAAAAGFRRARPVCRGGCGGGFCRPQEKGTTTQTIVFPQLSCFHICDKSTINSFLSRL